MDFRFKIGELVYTKVGIHEAQVGCRAGVFVHPAAYMVLETLGQTCPAGIEQRHYLVSHPSGRYRANEIELAPLSDWDEQAAVEAYLAAETAQAERRRAVRLGRREAE